MRGTGVVKRAHSTNYHTVEADRRLQESIATAQNKSLNSLQVDAFDISYYQFLPSTQICTCKRTEVASQSSLKQNVLVDSQGGLTIDYSAPLFGTRDNVSDEDEFGILDDEAIDTGDGTYVDNTLSSANCALCYRTGYVPGYQRYSAIRLLLTTHNIANVGGYTIDQTTYPHTFQLLGSGFVEFAIEVPKFFKSVWFSIRNNTARLTDVLYASDGTVLTTQHFRAVRGSTLSVRVSAEFFTHVVVEFDLGSDPLKVNISQVSRTLDWTMFDSTANLTVNMPVVIANVAPTDLIHVSKLGLTLKVVDVGLLRTASGRNIDWSISTRVLQPTEAAKYIAELNRVV